MISPNGIALIKAFEGIEDGDPSTVNLDPYLCPAGYWTIGWGHVVLGPDGKMLHGRGNAKVARAVYPNGITMAEAEALLADDLRPRVRAVSDLSGRDTDQFELDAMVAFVFNIGVKGFAKSSVLRLHRAGNRWSDSDAARLKAIIAGTVKPTNAPDAFLLWNKSGGRVLKGLVNRRAAERRLYLGRDWR